MNNMQVVTIIALVCILKNDDINLLMNTVTGSVTLKAISFLVF